MKITYLSVFCLRSVVVLNRIEYAPDYYPYLLPVDGASAIDLAGFGNVDLVLLDVDRQFESIVDNYVDEYYAARLPNPCVLHNQKIKFGIPLNVEKPLCVEATPIGRYVRIVRSSDWLDQTSSENRSADAFFIHSASDYGPTLKWLTKGGCSIFGA